MSQRGESGTQGDDIRSDCHVAIESRTSGGLQVEVTSKVEAFYGTSIRETIEDVLGTLGAEHARVSVDDKGALPFVLEARIEE